VLGADLVPSLAGIGSFELEFILRGKLALSCRRFRRADIVGLVAGGPGEELDGWSIGLLCKSSRPIVSLQICSVAERYLERTSSIRWSLRVYEA